MKHLGDITKIYGGEIEPVDCVTGGSPCQDLSVAGKRAGLAGERSGLFMEQIRIIKEMREHDRATGRSDKLIRPRYMVWENVCGAFSSNGGEDFRAVLEETARVCDPNASIPRPTKWQNAGCIMGNGWSIAWRVHDAQFWGVPQRRKRIALVADFNGYSAPEVLFERKSLQGNSDKGDTQGQTTTKATPTGTPGAKCFGISPYHSNCMLSDNPHSGVYEADTSRTLDLNGGNPSCNQGGIAVVEPMGVDLYNLAATNDKAVSLTTQSNATGSGPRVIEPVLLESNQNHATVQTDGISTALPASMGMGGGYVPMVTEPVAYGVNCSGGADIQVDKELYGCLTAAANSSGNNKAAVFAIGNGQTAQMGIHDKTYALDCMHDQQAVMVYGMDRASFNQGKNAKYDFSVLPEQQPTLTAKGPGAVCNYTVRRLTPLECERLQGFPDGWTDIGKWTDSKGRKRDSSDANRYKALGNSIALPFWKVLLKRISAQYDRDATLGSLFDGIGGFPLCWEQINGRGSARWASEIEEFPIAVTQYHFKGE